MTLSPTRPRAGLTLIEVLVAIFIMAIGLLALLVLFPLGALSMARAVRDDRAAAAGSNAASLAVALDYRNDPSVVTALNGAGGSPVYLDPLYAQMPNSTSLAGIPRCSLSLLNGNAPLTATLFTLLDEMQFDANGQASLQGANINRPATYTWAYMVRRTGSNYTAVTEMSVVVYSGRSLDIASGENAFPAGGAKDTNVLSVTYTAAGKPNIRKGTWVLDVSPGPSGALNGFFYQVTTAVDGPVVGTNPSLTVELETNLKANVSSNPNVVTIDPKVSNLVVMEKVITVLDRGAAWRP